jgi:hypothetical protein
MIDFSEIQRRITNGMPIEELEARLKPQEPEFKEGEWSDHSGGGFLAPDEKLIEVVRSDYDTLRVLGKNYEDMAQVAANVLEQVSREGYRGGNRLTAGVKKLLAKHWKPVANIDRKKFTPMQIMSMGSQSCPWGCSGKDESGYQTSGGNHVYVMEKGHESSGWMEKYLQIQMEAGDKEFPDLGFNEAQEARREVLRDLEKEIGIEFGGMDRVLYLSAFTVITDLTPHLIASHFFFEGDASYRTDPSKLIKVAGME